MGFSLPRRISVIATKIQAAVTFQQVLRSVTAERFAKADQVKVKSLKVTKKGEEVVKAVAKTASSGSSQVYDTEIEFKAQKKIKLSCSCDDFVFRFEWVLYNKGSADLAYGNGEPPDKTNPARTLGCCKHIVALRNYMIQKDLIEPTA